jgi:hypothetical protein
VAAGIILMDVLIGLGGAAILGLLIHGLFNLSLSDANRATLWGIVIIGLLCAGALFFLR